MTAAEERTPYVPVGWRAVAPFENIERGDMYFLPRNRRWQESEVTGREVSSTPFSFIRKEA